MGFPGWLRIGVGCHVGEEGCIRVIPCVALDGFRAFDYLRMTEDTLNIYYADAPGFRRTAMSKQTAVAVSDWGVAD